MDEEDQQPKKSYKLNDFGMLPLEDQVQAPIVKAMRFFAKFVDGPTSWFKESVVERFRGPAYPYYHRKFTRVPEINECYTDDLLCIYEADKQFNRDRRVDLEILKILRQRYFRCTFYERPINEYDYNLDQLCVKEKADLKQAQLDIFIKYGELGPYQNVIYAFMKQKHRLIVERRQKEQQTNLVSS